MGLCSGKSQAQVRNHKRNKSHKNCTNKDIIDHIPRNESSLQFTVLQNSLMESKKTDQPDLPDRLQKC